MPHVRTQKQFQQCAKPSFCYICGKPLDNGERVNKDHCPPQGMFKEEDLVNYPIVLKVHQACNARWSGDDEIFAVMYDVLHGSQRGIVGRRPIEMMSVLNEQGPFLGSRGVPFFGLVYRVVRVAHALLYGEFVDSQTRFSTHIPVPEVDEQNGNRPKMHEMSTYAFGHTLCTAQKTNTFDSLVAFNNAFKYVCTWAHSDGGLSMCIFAFDIYRLAGMGIQIQDFPRAVIGSYVFSRPKNATLCSRLHLENSDAEILYPILLP